MQVCGSKTITPALLRSSAKVYSNWQVAQWRTTKPPIVLSHCAEAQIIQFNSTHLNTTRKIINSHNINGKE